MATSDNAPLLFHLAGRTKTVKDAESQEYSKVKLKAILFSLSGSEPLISNALQNLYVMSELAQHIIKTRTQAQGWSLPTFPGKTKLPDDIFQPHSSAESMRKVRDSLVDCGAPRSKCVKFTRY